MDFSSVYEIIDWSPAIGAVLAIGVAYIAVFVAIKGVRLLLSMVNGGGYGYDGSRFDSDGLMWGEPEDYD